MELIVDDQDFTHDWLREGAVLGCVSTVAEALRGCSAVALGTMRYIAVASPSFCERLLPDGLNRSNFARVPWLVFNRKDDMHALWVAKAFGVQGPRLVERFVPSTEAHVRAAEMGWGIGVMPEQMAAPALADGALVGLFPEVWIDVLLHWHQWKLRTDDSSAEPALRAGALDRIGRALIDGARVALKPAPG
jgi:LysR family transcriptional regulator, chromosome initiation inhibitor